MVFHKKRWGTDPFLGKIVKQIVRWCKGVQTHGKVLATNRITGSSPVLITIAMLPTPRVSESLKGVQSVLQGRPW
jgi:hypothetical protein